MAGIGAWHFGPYHRDMGVGDPRQEAGIIAFKKELIYCGYGTGIKADVPVFGNMMEARTKDFQSYAGLTPDGIIGYHTARVLFRKRSNAVQKDNGIPHSWLARMKSLESNNDPTAQGYFDPDDEGLMQLHLPYWDGWTKEKAWKPELAMPAAGERLVMAAASIGDWKGAVASYNIGGYYAEQWFQAGYPASGGPIMGHDSHGNPIDAWVRATNYIAAVQAQTV